MKHIKSTSTRALLDRVYDVGIWHRLHEHTSVKWSEHTWCKRCQVHWVNAHQMKWTTWYYVHNDKCKTHDLTVKTERGRREMHFRNNSEIGNAPAEAPRWPERVTQGVCLWGEVREVKKVKRPRTETKLATARRVMRTRCSMKIMWDSEGVRSNRRLWLFWMQDRPNIHTKTQCGTAGRARAGRRAAGAAKLYIHNVPNCCGARLGRKVPKAEG